YVKNGKAADILHKDFYREILKNHSELKDYAGYSYLYFPRGTVFRDTDSDRVIFNYPPELSGEQFQRLMKRLKIDSDKVETIDTYHYSFSQLEKALQNTNWNQRVK